MQRFTNLSRNGAPRRAAGPWLSSVFFLAAAALSLPAHAAPRVDAIEEAGERFNSGRSAYEREDFAAAAEHFEAADALVPNAKVLLLAIRSRLEANQLGRAATLVALAQATYPDDPLFEDVLSLLESAHAEYGRLEVRCEQPCTVLVGNRLMHGPPSERWTLFLPAGQHSVRAGFVGAGESRRVGYISRAGDESEVTFSPPEPQPAPSAPPEDLAEQEQTWAQEMQEPAKPPSALAEDTPAPVAESSGLSPAWFWVGAAATGVMVGVSTWSGINTLNEPGEQEVWDKCERGDTSCPTYQKGLEAQSRTNVLWGVTAGLGVLTGVVAIFTDWGSEPTPNEATTGVEPVIGIGAGSAMFSARGQF